MLSFFRKKVVIIKRKDHCISRKNIDHDAVKVLYRLSRAGFRAYLVGGGVRDLLLGRQPKDFDVGTDARPNEIRRLFKNCFLIGRRFRLAHIVYGKKIIETSTFRTTPDATHCGDDKIQRNDNTFGTPEEDANRRDFTVNGIFYDISDFSVIDYVGGLKDLKKKIIRTIGNAADRFQEDPVRMMRAIKFASRLEFKIERSTRAALVKHHSDILKASPPRVCEEIFRLFSFGAAERAFRLLYETGMMRDLFPVLADFIDGNGGGKCRIWKYLRAADNFQNGAELSNGVKLAVVFYAFLDAKFALGAMRESGARRVAHSAEPLFESGFCAVPIPRATVVSAEFCINSLGRFGEKQHSRLRRFAHHAEFSNALSFAQIVAAAENRPADFAVPWLDMTSKRVQEKTKTKPPPF
jgi:poly(A) polymerase